MVTIADMLTGNELLSDHVKPLLVPPPTLTNEYVVPGDDVGGNTVVNFPGE